MSGTWNGLQNQVAVSVTNAATKLITTDGIPGKPWKAVIITPTDGDIYYGGPGVTAANGQPLFANQTAVLPIQRDGSLYAIRAASANVDVRVTPAY